MKHVIMVPEIKELFSMSSDLESKSKLFSVVEFKRLNSINPLAIIKFYNPPLTL
jgi:hypothetical protein